MQTCYGKWKPRLFMLLIGMLGVGAACLWALAPVLDALERHQSPLAALNGMTPCGVFGLVVACCCVQGLIDSFSVYRINGEWIEKRRMKRVISFSWQSLTACRFNGQRGDYYTLINNDGQRLKINTPFISDPQGALRAALDTHLKPLEESRQDFGALHRIFNPLRGQSYVFIPFLIPILGLWFSGLHDPEMMDGSVHSAFLNSLLLTLTVTLGCAALHCYTWTLTVGSDAISSDALLRHRRIRYGQVEKLYSHIITGRNGSTHITTLEGAGQSISITGAMDGYDALCSYLESRTEAILQARRQSAPIKAKSREPWQSIKGTLLCFGGFAALQSVVFFIPAGAQIVRQNQLDAHGATVKGKLVAARAVGRKDPAYYEDYEFVVNGQTRRASDSVTSDAANPGDAIDVTYLPNNPAVSRPADSSARKRAEELFSSGCFFIGVVGILPLIIVVCLLFRRPQRSSDD